jgi:hypothetical protein
MSLVKMMVVATCALMSLSSQTLAFTGGLDYLLRVYNDDRNCDSGDCAKTHTTVEVLSAESAPLAESPGIPLSRYEVPASGLLPNFSLGRIEYPVAFNSSETYLTTIKMHVEDSKLGPTDCTFEFAVGVYYSVSGSTAKVLRASANGIDSSQFNPGASNRRCQVYPFALQGPSMEVRSQKGLIKRAPRPSRLNPR